MSYPVTPLAAFALSGAFDKSDAINAINALNLGAACPAIPAHAKAPSGRRVDDRGLVHVWSPSLGNPTVFSGLCVASFAQATEAILGDRTGRRTLISGSWPAATPDG